MPDEKKKRVKKTESYHIIFPTMDLGTGFDKQVDAEKIAKTDCNVGESLVIIRKIKTITKKEIVKTKFEET